MEFPKSLVDKEYNKILAEIRRNELDTERIARQSRDVFRQRDEKLARHIEYCKQKNLIVPQWRIDPSRYRTIPSNNMNYYFMDGFEPIGLNVRSASIIKPLPPTVSFVKVISNIRAPDERILHNIPNTHENSKLIDELSEVYDAVHGDGKEHPSSEMFVKLIDSLQKDQPATSSGMPSFAIFKAVSDYFIGFGSAEELYDKYVSLNPQKRIIDKNSNSDGPNAENVSADRALHSYQTMFCRICYMYDCLKHHPLERPKIPHLNLKYLCKEILLPNKSCSSNCYMKMPGMIKKSKKRRKEIFKKALENTKKQHGRNVTESEILKCCQNSNSTASHEVKNTEFMPSSASSKWGPQDLTLFRVLQKMFVHNYCAISRFMLTKTCRQVYEMSKVEEIASPEFYLHISEPPKRRPKMELKTNEENMFYHPSFCDHQDRKCDDSCECVENHSVCEKFCNCDPNCPYRFQGCRCVSDCDTTQCICFKYARECDPDLCKRCNAGQYKMDDRFKCNNVNMQRGLSKSLLLAPSDVSGWGIFLRNPVRKFAFISEYCGELISHSEAERRGVFYDFKQMSYMFNLDTELVVDAARKGSLIRFANHKSKPNCYVKIHLVNGDYRIGIYANANIDAGQELFISYEYNEEHKKKYSHLYHTKKDKK